MAYESEERPHIQDKDNFQKLTSMCIIYIYMCVLYNSTIFIKYNKDIFMLALSLFDVPATAFDPVAAFGPLYITVAESAVYVIRLSVILLLIDLIFIQQQRADTVEQTRVTFTRCYIRVRSWRADVIYRLSEEYCLFPLPCTVAV